MPRNITELRELGDQDLLERLESHKEELFNLRFQLATGQLDNPMRIKQVRHDVARILTVLRERLYEQEIEEEFARVDRETLAHAREGRAEPAERRGVRRRRVKAEEAVPQEEPAPDAEPNDSAEEEQ
jgi:large subunit ribosomal protein L29